MYIYIITLTKLYFIFYNRHDVTSMWDSDTLSPVTVRYKMAPNLFMDHIIASDISYDWCQQICHLIDNISFYFMCVIYLIYLACICLLGCKHSDSRQIVWIILQPSLYSSFHWENSMNKFILMLHKLFFFVMPLVSFLVSWMCTWHHALLYECL